MLSLPPSLTQTSVTFLGAKILLTAFRSYITFSTLLQNNSSETSDERQTGLES